MSKTSEICTDSPPAQILRPLHRVQLPNRPIEQMKDRAPLHHDRSPSLPRPHCARFTRSTRLTARPAVADEAGPGQRHPPHGTPARAAGCARRLCLLVRIYCPRRALVSSAASGRVGVSQSLRSPRPGWPVLLGCDEGVEVWMRYARPKVDSQRAAPRTAHRPRQC